MKYKKKWCSHTATPAEANASISKIVKLMRYFCMSCHKSDQIENEDLCTHSTQQDTIFTIVMQIYINNINAQKSACYYYFIKLKTNGSSAP